ncbi:hypothetical protein E4U15_005542 [Claviceps sp. LM218 group G6]|nr:hypothetical protein E4U15_005542 [Claviceps sp. LM218 group G6]
MDGSIPESGPRTQDWAPSKFPRIMDAFTSNYQTNFSSITARLSFNKLLAVLGYQKMPNTLRQLALLDAQHKPEKCQTLIETKGQADAIPPIPHLRFSMENQYHSPLLPLQAPEVQPLQPQL